MWIFWHMKLEIIWSSILLTGNEIDPYQIVERKAFAERIDYIRSDIIPNKKIVPITLLTIKLECLMLSGGVNILHNSTQKKTFIGNWNASWESP